MSISFRIGRSTVHDILKETCKLIWDVLQQQYVKAPTTPDECVPTVHSSKKFGIFRIVHRYVHAHIPVIKYVIIGAIDGIHVIQAPSNAGSAYFNYKGTHSIVLMAVCDALCRFTLIDIGDCGRHSDGGVLSNSAFGQALENESLNIPACSPLPGTSVMAPYVIVADEAFPLQSNFL